ncbi:hypothetical protein SCHPADRAFT_896965 [Schizopora paradoxa]|uniref:Uncharacterized protein n=1 Tax=Schizopora paradoxa TaxID=27342 RepID=A0A0H2R4Z3_9AGAM|nr:hypothetical protein SCHPADRAFT_896965 [Schizopora paradoxa]
MREQELRSSAVRIGWTLACCIRSSTSSLCASPGTAELCKICEMSVNSSVDTHLYNFPHIGGWHRQADKTWEEILRIIYNAVRRHLASAEVCNANFWRQMERAVCGLTSVAIVEGSAELSLQTTLQLKVETQKYGRKEKHT